MEETVNSVDSSETGAFLLTGGVLYARAHLEPAQQLPIGVGAKFFVTSSTPRPSQPSKCFRSMALHPPTPSYHYTSWGPLCCSWMTSTTSSNGNGVRSTSKNRTLGCCLGPALRPSWARCSEEEVCVYFTIFVTVRAVDVHQFPHQSVRGPDRPSSRALLQVLLPCVSPHLLQHSLALVIKAFRTVRLILPDADRGREGQREESRQTYVCTAIHPTCGPFKSKYKHTCTCMDNTHTHREREERTIGACCTFLCTHNTAEQMYAHTQQQ